MRGQHRTQAVAAVDVGSSKVVAAIAVPEESGLRVLGVGRAQATGVRRGAVVDIPLTAAALAAAAARARRVARQPLPPVTLGSAGGGLWSGRREAELHLDAPEEIAAGHVARLMQEVRAVALPGSYQVVHTIPLDFRVDGYEGCTQPIGMTAQHLVVAAHIVACQETLLANLWKVAAEAGVEVREFALSGLAAADAVLSDGERQTGIVVADLGAEATQVTAFIGGEAAMTAVIPLGGAHISRDIGAALGLGLDAAEAVKLRQATVDDTAASDRPLEWPPGTGPRPDGSVEATERGLCSVVRARAEEMLERVAEALDSAQVRGQMAAGIVLTGGGSRLRGLPTLALHVLSMRVRCAGAMGAPGELGAPELAATVGLLQGAARRETGERRLPPFAAVGKVALARWRRRVGGG